MPRVKVPIPVEEPVVNSTQEPSPIVEDNGGDSLPAQPVFWQRWTNQQLIIGAAGLLFLVLVIMMFKLMSDRNHLQTQVNKLSSSSTSGGSEEIRQITAQIGQYFELPSGETPTIATVTDINKVRNQAFFKNARNGDKVLLYAKAGQAILYRPSSKKIISVAPVDLNKAGNTSSSATGGTQTTP